MTMPLLPDKEYERLNALNGYHLLDTLPEEDFDNITYIASVICQTPISLISLVDKERQFFKSHFGLSVNETSRDISFCAHAINQPQLIFEIEDARLDERFHDNTQVTGSPNAVFYAGIPLVDANGYALGTLCVIDQKPRKLTIEQKEALTKLSKQVMFIIEARQKKIIEKELKLFDFAFNNSAMPITLAKEDSSIYYINEAAASNLGYTLEELKGKKIIEIDDSFDKDKWTQYWLEIKSKETLSIESTPKKKDGTIINLVNNINYLKHGDLDLICFYSTNITENKKLSNQLKLTDFAFRNSVVPMHFLQKDGSIYDFNESACALLGYTKEEYKKLNACDINRNMSPDNFTKMWENIFSGNQATVIETTLTTKNNEIIDVEIRTNALKFDNIDLICSTFIDITEKKKQEQRLELLDYSYKRTDSAMSFLDANGLFIDFNLATANMLGYSYEEFRGKTIMDINPMVTQEFWIKRWEELIVTSNQKFEAKFKRKDGTIIDVAVSTNSIELNGKIVNFGFYEDITEKKKVAEDLKLMDFSFKNSATPIMLLLPSGEFYSFNDSLLNLLGYSQEEFSKINLLNVATKMDEASCIKQWEEIREKKNVLFQCHFERKDCVLLDVEISSNLINYNDKEVMFCYVNDITEKKKAAENQELSAFTINNASFGLAYFNADGTIYNCNLAFAKIYGYTSLEEVKTKTVFDFDEGYTTDTWKKYWYFLRKKKSAKFVAKRTKTDGTIIDVEINANIIQFGDKELSCVYINDVTENVKTIERLKLSDHIIHKATTAIYLLKSDGSIYDFNEAASTMFGYTKEEFAMLHKMDIDPNSNQGIMDERYEILRREGKVSFQTKMVKKGGDIIDVEITSTFIVYDGLELKCSFITDVTERIILQKELDKQRLFYEDILNNMPTEIAVFSEDFRYQFVNLAGLSNPETRKWIIGKTDKEYIAYKNGDNVAVLDRIPFYQEVVNKGKSITWEEELKDKSGEIIYVSRNLYPVFDDVGKLKMIIGYGYNTTNIHLANAKAKLFELGFRNIQTPSIIVEINNGRMYDFNEAALNVLGYTTDEFKQINISDIDILIDIEELIKLNKQISEFKSLTRYTSFKKKDNTLISVECKLQYLFFEGTELNYVFFTDITQKLKAEEELKQSNQRYEYATLATSDVIWEADLLKNEIFISKNFTTIFGHPVIDGWAPMENNIWRQNIHPDEADDVIKSQYQPLSNETIINNWNSEYRLRKSNGTYAMVLDRTFGIRNEQGKIVKMVGAIQDITKRKEEEERLRLMEAVVLNTNDAILIADAGNIDEPGPRITFTNHAFQQMNGYSEDEIIGKTPRILQTADTDRNELDKLRKALINWESCEITVKNKKKNGEFFWVTFRVTPIKDKNGWFTHWLSVQRDVTNEIEAALEKENLLKELVANNLELKQFSYITTHNLRAPLTNLVSICDIIQPGPGTDALTLQLIDSFKISTHHLNETLKVLIDVLIIKENRNIQKDQLTFEETFKKISESLSMTLLEKKVILNVDFSAAPSVIFANAYLESVFLNLITNAVKYCHPDRDPIITIKSNKEPNGDIKLTFSDNGIGINMALAKGKIFGLYKRFHNNADSKGIGLYLIHSQITTLGGQIEVESEVNIGTTFIITFK